MQETLRLLQGLQELDMDLFRVRKELERLPAEKARRRSRIDAQLDQLAELDHRIQGLGVRIKEIEDLTTSQRQRMRKLEGEASSSRGDTALLIAFQHEIRSLRRQVSEAEEEGLGLVEESDVLTTQREELRQTIDEEERVFAEFAGNVEAELSAARAREESLSSRRRERMHGGIPSEVLVQYEKLLGAREGNAMAILEGRVCQGCYVTVPSNIYVRLARGTDLVCCPSCGRILYIPES